MKRREQSGKTGKTLAGLNTRQESKSKKEHWRNSSFEERVSNYKVSEPDEAEQSLMVGAVESCSRPGQVCKCFRERMTA